MQIIECFVDLYYRILYSIYSKVLHAEYIVQTLVFLACKVRGFDRQKQLINGSWFATPQGMLSQLMDQFSWQKKVHPNMSTQTVGTFIVSRIRLKRLMSKYIPNRIAAISTCIVPQLCGKCDT